MMERTAVARASRYLAICVAMLFLAAACTDEEGNPVESVDLEAGSDDGAGDGDATSSDENDQTDEEEAMDEPASDGSGGDLDRFCEVAGVVDAGLDDLDFDMAPADLEMAITETNDQMAMALDYAPDDIRETVAINAEAFGLMSAALEDANYSMLDVDFSTISVLDEDPKFEIADDDLNQYLFTNCGIGTDPALDADPLDDDDDIPLPEGTAREQIVQQLTVLGFTEPEATCLAEQPDLLSFSPSGSDSMATLLGAFEVCGIPATRLTELGFG